MSFVNANLPIQRFISNYGNIGRTWAVLQYVQAVSAANSSVELVPNSFLRSPGKLRTVRMNYWPIQCDVDGTCSQDVCGTGTDLEPHQIDFTIDRCISSKLYSLSKDNVRLTDEGAWDYTGIVRQIINSILPGLRKQHATEVETALYDMAGVHLNGAEEVRVTTTNNQTGIVNPIGMFDIQREFLDGGFSEPYLLGGTEVYNWQKMTGIGGLNAEGQRIDMLTAKTWYDDGLGAAILNDLVNGDHILAIAPEVFKYVWYLENAGIFATSMTSIDDINRLFQTGSETVLNGTLIDPVTGFPWDLDIYFSPCSKKVNFQLKHQYGLFLMPETACNVQGVNGIMHYRTCPPLAVSCPSGSPLASPAAASTFTWDPGFAYPLGISKFELGGVTVNMNAPVLVTTDAELTAVFNDNYGDGSLFSLVGSNLTYSGYSALAGQLNDTVTVTFA